MIYFLVENFSLQWWLYSFLFDGNLVYNIIIYYIASHLPNTILLVLYYEDWKENSTGLSHKG